MDYDADKVDDMVLALFCLTLHEEYGAVRAWKGYDWDVLDRLYHKGWILDPRNKAKSVVLTDEGRMRAERLFETYFRPSD